MAARLPNELIDRILQMVKESRKECTKAEIGRRFLFKRHCGMRMVKVKVFMFLKTGTQCPTHQKQKLCRTLNEVVCVCPDCLYHYTDPDPSVKELG